MIDQVPQAQTVDMPKTWPLVAKMQSRQPIVFPVVNGVPVLKDAHLINGYVEFDPEDNEFWVYKRPGLSPTAVANTSANPISKGIYSYPLVQSLKNTNFISVGMTATPTSTSAAVLYDNQPGSYSSLIGSLNSNFTSKLFFQTVNTGPGSNSLIAIGATNMLATGQEIQLYNPSSHAITTVVIPSLNFLAVGFAYLDGTLYVMDVAGSIWGSNINAPSTWVGTNVIQANADVDPGVALARQLNYVVAFKQWSTQIFLDNGNPPPGSPLSPVQQSQLPIGCLDGGSLQNIDDTLLWVTASRSAAPQIARLDNLVPKIISTPPVERIIANLVNAWGSASSDGNPAHALPYQTLMNTWSMKFSGHRWYGITIAQLNITLVYDLDQDFWYFWTDANGNYWPVGAVTWLDTTYSGTGPYTSVPGKILAQHATNGNIYGVDGAYNYPNDVGVLFPVDIYTPNTGFGTVRRKTMSGMYFTADQTPGSVLNIRHNDNDFDPTKWTNFRNIDLSRKKPRLQNDGTFTSRRSYHMRHYCNTDFRIKSSSLQIDLGVI
jgi:hypothetical protein